MLPIPTSEDKILTGRPVTQEQLALLASNDATKDEVIRHLGQPDIIWEDAQLFIYRWQMRQGILLWAVGGMSGGATSGGGGVTDIPRQYFVIVQFDEADRVVRFDRTGRSLWESDADFLKKWLTDHPKPASR